MGEPFKTVQDRAREIDAYYDAMLYDGIPMDRARWVEEQREAAHQRLTEAAIMEAVTI